MPLQLTIGYPDAIPKFLHGTREQFEQEAKTAMAGKLFEMKRLSSGREKTILSCFLSGVEIKTVSIPPALNGATARGVLWQASPGRYLLKGGMRSGRFLVEGGERITVERDASADDERLFFHLLHPVMAAVLRQRGLLFYARVVTDPVSLWVV